jgi:pseudouridine-5'-phosphate glycosidase
VIELSDEVLAAVQEGAAVVALESTLIAHGLPYPDNLAIARELEDTVREAGAVPATIAVLDGIPRVGLDDAALERLARPGAGVAKAGAPDLAALAALGLSAATTVGATGVLAARVGIRVFATGGIGGVHREAPWDVSNDLEVLARTPIAVVASGAKAILDLPRTLELLETLGVLVIGYKTDELPSFYSRTSGLPLEHRMYRPVDVARAMRLRFAVLGQGGVLVANPIPAEFELPAAEITDLVERALADAARVGVRGKQVTPFVLARMAGLSAGRTVTANRALVVSNAQLAAQIAIAFAREWPEASADGR